MKTGATKGGSFFRTMVLMGSSVAVGSGVAAGCGGSAELVPGTGGGPSTGGSPGAGGSGTGGGTSSGGIILGDGGSTASGGLGGLGGAFPTDCPTTQLDCPDPNYAYCSFNSSMILPTNCECDSARPRSAEDCDADEDFVCLMAGEDAQGEPFEPVAPFNCECVPEGEDAYCNSRCTAHSASPPNYVTCTEPEDDLDAYLCGCALTILK